MRVLARYAVIDGWDMTVEAIRPRVKGEMTFVDGLITFAVDTANQRHQGIAKVHWDGLIAAERFYLKLVDLEAKGLAPDLFGSSVPRGPLRSPRQRRSGYSPCARRCLYSPWLASFSLRL